MTYAVYRQFFYVVQEQPQVLYNLKLVKVDTIRAADESAAIEVAKRRGHLAPIIGELKQ